MNGKMRNILLWLTALVLLAGLITALGISLARYRTDHSQSLFFTVQKPGQLYMGTMATTDEPDRLMFIPQSVGTWETADDSLRLAFTVANGTSGQAYTQQDQCFSVQLVGGLGIWDGTDLAEVTLRVHKPLESQYDEFSGTAKRIRKESPLYRTYGDGWVFSFLNEAGEERTWPLSGTAFSTVDMTLVLEGSQLTDPSLLQPIITGY